MNVSSSMISARRSFAVAASVSALAALGLLIDAGCSSVDTAACASLTEGTCPSKAPSYATEVAPILASYCTSCHAAGGEESDVPLTSYASASAQASSMSGEVKGCDMPPSDSTQPTSAERQTLLDWIACGAPQ